MVTALILVCIRFALPAMAATTFDLKDVQVLGGPLKAAQDADAKYLFELNPDAFLNPYLRAVGLTPKAPFYGGWEARDGGNSGEILGHYLSAASEAWVVTGEIRFKQNVDHIVDELAECQARRRDGALYYDSRLDQEWQEVSRGDIRVTDSYVNGTATWYRVHKLLAGLLEAQRLVGNQRALSVARRLGDWACEITRNLSSDQWQHMLDAEFGGVNESLAELTARTGDGKYLALARRFHHKSVCDPLSKGQDRLAGLHANTQIPKIVGEARIYELTGDPSEKRIAEYFWDTVTRHHSYAVGGNSRSEHFGPPDRVTDDLAADDCETCNTYNMEKLTRHLFCWAPKAEYGDWYERALFNQILGSQDPETGMMCYFAPLDSGHNRQFSTPFDSFWCCVGTGMENHMLHGAGVYFKHGADHLWVNQFVPSELHWKAAGVRLKQETLFPSDGKIALRIVGGEGREFEMSIRKPGWAQALPEMTLNGGDVRYEHDPSGFLSIRRRWRAGDILAVHFKLSLRVEPSPGDPAMVTVAYGPNVLSLDLDESAGLQSGPARSWLEKPVLLQGAGAIDECVTRAQGDPLEFVSAGPMAALGYVYRPYSQVRHHRCATYFTVRDAKELSAEFEKQRQLDARTTDFYQPGDAQGETDHLLRGDKTRTGEGGEAAGNWRDATDGGWFSFEMRSDPDRPMTLVLTYWGSDDGSREFDIVVNGARIAREKLANKHPHQFYDVEYALPLGLTQSTPRVTVRLQALPGNVAGGLWKARLMRGWTHSWVV